VSGSDAQLELFFAGIRFALEGPRALLAVLEEVPCARRWSETPASACHAAASVCCLLAPLESPELAAPAPPCSGPSGAPAAERRLAWNWHGTRASLRSRHASAELDADSGAARCRAQLTPNRRGAESLLLGLAGALLHRAGGAILHAAGLELAGEAIAMIGPSGAGKSTAGRQLEGGRLFSADRLAVAPSAAGWLAYALPGGTRSVLDLPASSSLQAPLRAVLRIRQAASGARLERCPPLQALVLLCQAGLHPGLEAEAEGELLAHLVRLSHEVPVANLHSSLGTLLSAPVSRWLAQHSSQQQAAAGN
jgi:hypothetical protein